MNPKNIIIGILVILLLGTGLLAFNFYNDLQTESDIHKKDVDNANEQITNLNDQISTLEIEKDSVITDLETKTSEYDDMQKKYDSLKKLYDSLQINFTSAQTQLRNLKKVAECDNLYKVNYNTNTTVSNSLKEIVGDRKGSVVSARWDTIWSNSKTALHYVATKDFLSVYLVYFDEPKLGYKNSTFFLDEYCWIDAP